MDGRHDIGKEGREWRRMRVMELKKRGWQQRDIAIALNVREETVSRWLAELRRPSPERVVTRPRAPGSLSKLNKSQQDLIPEMLSHGAESYGFRGHVWTCARIARVIQEEIGVSYHKGHVSRLLKALKWSPQVPIKRALQRDERAIEHWRVVVWPELQRRARKERRTLVFTDESGFYLLPGVVRTYAPVAHTPVLREKQTRDHLSVMAGMTTAGKLYTLVRQESLTGSHVVEFLQHLLRLADRRLLIIWDGSPIHRRVSVTEYIAAMGSCIRVERLPAYAPDLNPWDEGGWHHLKHVEMANLVSRDLEELHEQFHLAVARLRRKPHIIQSFFAQAGLSHLTVSHNKT